VWEKTGKNFSGLGLHRKTSCDQRLGRDARQKAKAWQGTGRETPKALDAVWHRLAIAMIMIK
jgi:hypothetical protein